MRVAILYGNPSRRFTASRNRLSIDVPGGRDSDKPGMVPGIREIPTCAKRASRHVGPEGPASRDRGRLIRHYVLPQASDRRERLVSDGGLRYLARMCKKLSCLVPRAGGGVPSRLRTLT